MSDDTDQRDDASEEPTPSSGTDLGPKPEAQIEPGEPNPGGADAQPDSDGVDGEATDGDVLPADPDPDLNPAASATPEETKTGEDTDTEATKSDEGSEDVPPEEESPA